MQQEQLSLGRILEGRRGLGVPLTLCEVSEGSFWKLQTCSFKSGLSAQLCLSPPGGHTETLQLRGKEQKEGRKREGEKQQSSIVNLSLRK